MISENDLLCMCVCVHACVCQFSQVYCMPCLFHPLWFDYPNNIWFRGWII